MSFLGSAIGGIASAIGSIFGGNTAKSGSIKGGRIAARATLKANRQNLKYQKQFAKNAVRWKAKDARRAGISKLAGIGAQTVGFSPSFVGATQAGQGVAAGAEQMGQGISRAFTALGSVDDRNDEYVSQMQKLQLQNASMQNALLASQLATKTQAGNPPAGPPASEDRYLVAGQGDSVRYSGGNLVKTSPLERTASSPTSPHAEGGAVTETGYLRTVDGYAPVKSQDATNRLEDDILGNIQHFIRNRVVQPLSMGSDAAPFKAPAGKAWQYNPIIGEWTLYDVPAYNGRAKDQQ